MLVVFKSGVYLYFRFVFFFSRRRPKTVEGARSGARRCGKETVPGAGGSARGEEPAGQWHKTWGAIASSPSTNEAGVATGRATKEDAERVALEGCGMHAARDCRILIAYRNQCAAWVVPQSQGNGARGGVASGQDLKEAIVQAQKICVDPTGTQCKVAYSACSEPVYEAF
ncbi:DUF4189 domain-containing protein [Stenotrophomonas maltophilia]|uniref:DUF4189 domain-containing protein n=1 Tax=Stenotrophomonas maltophilia TaxID=40324 RepID=A0A3S0HDQ2_STEMA|nr:DUF4189 domain-containing protein [Stenotrophomonas maltophilia]